MRDDCDSCVERYVGRIVKNTFSFEQISKNLESKNYCPPRIFVCYFHAGAQIFHSRNIARRIEIQKMYIFDLLPFFEWMNYPNPLNFYCQMIERSKMCTSQTSLFQNLKYPLLPATSLRGYDKYGGYLRIPKSFMN